MAVGLLNDWRAASGPETCASGAVQLIRVQHTGKGSETGRAGKLHRAEERWEEDDQTLDMPARQLKRTGSGLWQTEATHSTLGTGATTGFTEAGAPSISLRPTLNQIPAESSELQAKQAKRGGGLTFPSAIVWMSCKLLQGSGVPPLESRRHHHRGAADEKRSAIASSSALLGLQSSLYFVRRRAMGITFLSVSSHMLAAERCGLPGRHRHNLVLVPGRDRDRARKQFLFQKCTAASTACLPEQQGIVKLQARAPPPAVCLMLFIAIPITAKAREGCSPAVSILHVNADSSVHVLFSPATEDGNLH
jgi:hypothetical protein